MTDGENPEINMKTADKSHFDMLHAQKCMAQNVRKYQVRLGRYDHLVIIDNGRWPDNGSHKHVNALLALKHTRTQNYIHTLYHCDTLRITLLDRAISLSLYLLFLLARSLIFLSFPLIRLTFNRSMQSS